MENLHYDDPRVDSWENTTLNVLESIFVRPDGFIHQNVDAFKGAHGGVLYVNMTDAQIQKNHVTRTKKRNELLRGFLDQLEIFPSSVVEKEETVIDPTAVASDRLMSTLRRFHKVARQLRSRHSHRSTLDIQDEYDVQDLVHALLRIDFDDIRPEEYTPSYAGKSTRMDFLLKDHGIVVEIKKTRNVLREKEIGDELLIDIARYATHPDCKTLVCFIYDPDGFIGNPRGLEKDLGLKSTGALLVKVIISPDA